MTGPILQASVWGNYNKTLLTRDAAGLQCTVHHRPEAAHTKSGIGRYYIISQLKTGHLKSGIS